MAKYTDNNNNITFNNVSQIGSGVNFPPVGSSNGGSGYVINKGKVESKGSPIVNAIDIDWNGAEVETNKLLNTSGDLIKWIKTSNDAKVDKVEGKGLSTNDYTTTEKNKLEGIESGAQVNVKPDWNAVAGADAEILNKPTIPAALIQSDWNQTDTTALDYIKNKPNLSGLTHFDILVVDNLPDSDISESTIYLLPGESTGTNNVYTEYIYIGNNWEKLGELLNVDIVGQRGNALFDLIIPLPEDTTNYPYTTLSGENFIEDAEVDDIVISTSFVFRCTDVNLSTRTLTWEFIGGVVTPNTSFLSTTGGTLTGELKFDGGDNHNDASINYNSLGILGIRADNITLASQGNINLSTKGAVNINGTEIGSAVYKNVTTSVTQNSTDLVTSGAVYSALQNVGGGSTYKLTVNGTTNGDANGTSLGSVYAPTSAASSSNLVVTSDANGKALWTSKSSFLSGFATTSLLANYVQTSTLSNYVKSVSVNGGTSVTPDLSGNVNLTVSTGGSSQADGVYYYTNTGTLSSTYSSTAIAIAVIYRGTKFLIKLGGIVDGTSTCYVTGKLKPSKRTQSLYDGVNNTAIIALDTENYITLGESDSSFEDDLTNYLHYKCKEVTLTLSLIGGLSASIKIPGYIPSFMEMLAIIKNLSTIKTMLNTYLTGLGDALSAFLNGNFAYTSSTVAGISNVSDFGLILVKSSGKVATQNDNFEASAMTIPIFQIPDVY